MKFVRVLVQECKPGTVEILTRKADETFVPRLRAIPGFIEYEVTKVNDRLLICSVYFETRAGADEMERLGAEWRRTIGKEEIVSAQPYIGEVILDRRSTSVEAHPSL